MIPKRRVPRKRPVIPKGRVPGGQPVAPKNRPTLSGSGDGSGGKVRVEQRTWIKCRWARGGAMEAG